jgi:hypothetical protein
VGLVKRIFSRAEAIRPYFKRGFVKKLNVAKESGA